MKHIDIAIEAAKAAGKIHKKYFETNVSISTKSSSFDLVTTADIEAEERVVEIIRRSYRDHNFLAEEQRYEKTESEYTWIIDPLDGTNNFAHNLPIFCASIALACRNEVRVGVIYDVTRDELFCAEKGKGAFLNGKPISVGTAETLEKSILVTGFYYDRGKGMLENLEWIKEFFMKQVMGIRRFGAAALDLCYVASGRVSGYWEFVLSPWDFAAGKLIIEEAGGIVTGRYGKDINPLESSFVVASNGKIHDKMLKVLK